MPDVMIRNLPAEDVQALKAAALSADRSLQAELWEVIHMHAQRARRRAALGSMSRHVAEEGVTAECAARAVAAAKDEYGAAQ